MVMTLVAAVGVEWEAPVRVLVIMATVVAFLGLELPAGLALLLQTLLAGAHGVLSRLGHWEGRRRCSSSSAGSFSKDAVGGVTAVPTVTCLICWLPALTPHLLTGARLRLRSFAGCLIRGPVLAGKPAASVIRQGPRQCRSRRGSCYSLGPFARRHCLSSLPRRVRLLIGLVPRLTCPSAARPVPRSQVTFLLQLCLGPGARSSARCSVRGSVPAELMSVAIFTSSDHRRCRRFGTPNSAGSSVRALAAVGMPAAMVMHPAPWLLVNLCLSVQTRAGPRGCGLRRCLLSTCPSCLHSLWRLRSALCLSLRCAGHVSSTASSAALPVSFVLLPWPQRRRYRLRRPVPGVWSLQLLCLARWWPPLFCLCLWRVLCTAGSMVLRAALMVLAVASPMSCVIRRRCPSGVLCDLTLCRSSIRSTRGCLTRSPPDPGSPRDLLSWILPLLLPLVHSMVAGGASVSAGPGLDFAPLTLTLRTASSSAPLL